MDIIFYHPTFDFHYWKAQLENKLPGATVRQWEEGDHQPADYALVWEPPVEMLKGRQTSA